MVGYATAPADVEVNMEEKMEVLEEKRPSTGWMWKVLVVVALCLGGLQLFALYWKGRPEVTAETAERRAPIPEEPTGTTDPHYMLKQFRGSAKAAIHLVGTVEDEEGSELEWRDDLGQAFTHGSFKLAKNRVVIPRGGLYFVYSQASFRVSCSGEDGAREPPAPPSHRVWRFSDSIGSKVSLMSAVRSVCHHGGRDGGQIGWYNTIYLGAVFQLNKGDQLWTETNLVSDLETDEGKTFFGVFAL